ncbi:MAG: choline-sulfatase, partial [Planktomarina sp.]
HGFQERITTDIYPSDFAWTPDWVNHDVRIDHWYHNMDVVKESGQAMATYQIDYDDEVEFTARRRLFDYGRDDTKPWCMVASFIHPHDPYLARPEWWNLYDDADIDMPLHPEYTEEAHGKRVLSSIEAYDKPLSDDEIRAARRAYYANVSYFDGKVGALVKTVEEMGQLDNTIIIVTADHGDMLGEKGLWYKMTMFERSVRIPMIIAGPGVVQGTNDSPVSLVDLLPTMVAMGGGSDAQFGMAISGRSLMPELQGQETDGEAIAEYCAEMTGHPIFMIRRGPFKYIHCDGDPAILYNVTDDPEERTNLAADPAHADRAQAFADEVALRWDSSAIRNEVIASQQNRFALNRTMPGGASDDWDYNPPSDASQQYVRNNSDWSEVAERFRFPKVPS